MLTPPSLLVDDITAVVLLAASLLAIAAFLLMIAMSTPSVTSEAVRMVAAHTTPMVTGTTVLGVVAAAVIERGVEARVVEVGGGSGWGLVEWERQMILEEGEVMMSSLELGSRRYLDMNLP